MTLLLAIAVLASVTIPQALANDLHSCALVCPPPQVCAPVHGQNSYICTVGSYPIARGRPYRADLPLRLTWLARLVDQASLLSLDPASCRDPDCLFSMGNSMPRAVNLDCLSCTGRAGWVQPGVRQGSGVQAGEGLRPARLPRRSHDYRGGHPRHAGYLGHHPRHDQHAGGRCCVDAQQQERPVGCAPA